ncbi:FAD-dependent oxidoreductase [Silvanigrella aquatica]|uniref:FAD-binding FR-type domain-containing protein n=1 Tax=Silvanigrella aquatica TaxID=1915309 RepID=A0A1L4D3U9_9BACT|nr:FAD-dependent oxidoreductase [Silvanigrella aquatica]APJ04852.1 hypothetical protein AXG55_13485 [Silvanigrella aquatica]
MNLNSNNIEHNSDFYSSKIIHIENINSNYLIFKINRPSNFNYNAGQFVSFKLSDDQGEFHYQYSIASNNKNKESLEFCIQTLGVGRGVQFWKKLKIGEIISFKNAQGNFNIVNYNNPIVFIAGGSGISPIRSFIYDLLEKNTHIHLVYGCKLASSIPFKKEFIDLSKKYSSHFKIKIVAEEEESDFVIKGDILSAIKNNAHLFEKNSDFYICGSQEMTKAVQNELINSIKINMNKIFIDNA